MKSKITVNNATEMRIREAFDFLRVCQEDLTDAQIEFIKGLRKQFRERGSLSERQMQCLWDIQKLLKPSSPGRVRMNY